MSQHSNLFKTARMGAIELPNRVLMAPMTRNRAKPDGTPGKLAEIYYAQRASAGLIVSEATQISPMGKGSLDTPGLHSSDQAEAWRSVTDAVHAAGGRIFCQLCHVGRISHVSLLAEGRQPEAPSVVRAAARTLTGSGIEDCSEPFAMSIDRIKDVIEEYRHAGHIARAAGFDGVELHAGDGYLLDQFLQDRTNLRDDEYGGSITNRMRLLGQVLDTLTDVWPSGRVGVRLSPLGQTNDIADSDPEALFSAVYRMLDARELAYLHVVEAVPGREGSQDETALIDRLHSHFKGFYIANGDYDAERAASVIEHEDADAVAFGRQFLANPDLPERFRVGAPLNAADPDTFFGGTAEGYTDYSTLDRSDAAA